ncbi:uncharacterized protein LOC107363880 isoform X2 [Tetranychus urticae]|uniref:uncharacterized protein LOC107363880 isoform X3 n=1 Tax=Tetranychus urticae TaxID=32264 RepID=UPI00077B94FF|nr:uncharacterized protein LOC107363880 isoform X3 [Tetranychus urticae]XP_025017026.1 uncharacterized protein LOC107363880 isoform X2 [Tetranychus urticae]
MAKPCAVFWDMQNIPVPKGKSVDFIVDLVRSAIIKPYNLDEIFFFCVCDVHKLPANIGHLLTNLDFQAHNGIKNSASIKIMDLMKKFVAFAGQDCTIILLSGEAAYYDALSNLKKLHNVSIHLIGLANSFSPKLVQIADNTFILNNGVLKPIKSTGSPSYFISVKNYPSSISIKQVMGELNGLAIGSIGNSAILYDCLICIGFPTLFNAEKAVEKLNGSEYHGNILKVDLIPDSPLDEILQYIDPSVTVQAKSNNEVKQLTFIEMKNSNEAVDIGKIIKFCIACTSQSGSQCILSKESYLWIVFSCKSDAQNFLPKVKIMYPDAVISEPPIGLTLDSLENSYFVESCEEIATDEVPSCLISLHGSDDTDWKIFFRYNANFIAPLLYYKPTKWSLLYNLFEKLYDLGAKKVICDGNLYCAHFDSASDYQDAFEKLRSRYLEPLESVYAAETRKKRVTMKMNRYSGIPWCFNEKLNLSCLVVKIESQLHDFFMEISKSTLGNRECIFIKSIPGEIWIAFPDELICKDSEKTVKGFSASLKLENNVSMAKPSKELLESINFRDLAGDAYDLAFLSSQLDLKPIKRPNIIERIRLQRMQEQECNETLFYFCLGGQFYDRGDFKLLSLEQIVKIFAKLSKVIPLAAKGSHDQITLIYNSWYEAHAAHHFIANLPKTEIPYFRKFDGTSSVSQLTGSCTSEYYIINDKRKVLEKIVQNKSLVDKLDSNSSKFQSTSDIDVLDEEMIKKLQYSFVITTDSEFKFTSGMISIIKMNLLRMNCPACIEFEDKIWVAVDDLEKGKKAKAEIEKFKFKLLHENDEEDFQVGVVMESIQESPPKVTKMLANKLMKPKTSVKNVYLTSDAFPLGHFNYSYRKAVGMSASRYYCLFNT